MTISEPILRDLWLIQDGPPEWLTDTTPTDPLTIRRWLALNSVRYIVLNKQANYQPALAYFERLNITQRFADDDEYIILKIGLGQPQ